MKYFAGNIKYLRKMHNLDQSGLAEKIGRKGGTAVSNWESGTAIPPVGVLSDLAHLFNVKIDDLMETDLTSDKNAEVEPTTLPSHSYPYIPADIAAGAPAEVDGMTAADMDTIDIPDAIMGKWAGRRDITLMHVNGQSMNRVIPDQSLIAVQKVDDVHDLQDGDIVVFDCDGEYSVKRFFDDQRSQTLVFNPDSSFDTYRPILYRYEDTENLQIVGKVAMYVVTL